MPIDPRRCKPGELIRLMNSTPMGAVLTESLLKKHRARAGLRLSSSDDQSRVDLFRYVGWLASERVGRISEVSKHPVGSPEFAEAAAAAARKLSVSQLANALGVHVSNVKHHVERGLPYSTDRRGIRRFNEKECRKWLVDRGSVHYNGGNKTGAYAAGQPENKPDKDDPNSPLQIELRLKLAKIDEIETKTAERKGTLVKAHEVQAIFTAHLAAARTAFEAVATKAAGRVLEIVEGDHSLHHKLVAAIKTELDQAMQSLSEAPL